MSVKKNLIVNIIEIFFKNQFQARFKKMPILVNTYFYSLGKNRENKCQLDHYYPFGLNKTKEEEKYQFQPPADQVKF